ncbi:hypothetical protein HW130_19020 [Streptomyces sp. PKU-EA00015]|uniref:hypothetical protein n=1 Tax=Streptomyces sp. PKU-EA00015 TaxID=2748326 RepID=UPI0015A1A95F|nr:hypothetical protein [Streptomyces sp. PKU-EA00015]NWF28335.1 hypothetical protein [Streptomyces sp. PKU-EA00015]
MPATLVAAHPVSALPPVETVSVSELSNQERAVALYASDMPTAFRMRRDDDAMVHGWIIQGAARLGLREVHRLAAVAFGYRLLWLADLATADQSRAQKRRFPSARRFSKAETTATLFTVKTDIPMSQAAKDRGPQVEGGCLCAGTGWIADSCDPEDPTMAGYISCPVDNPRGAGLPQRPAVIA